MGDRRPGNTRPGVDGNLPTGNNRPGIVDQFPGASNNQREFSNIGNNRNRTNLQGNVRNSRRTEYNRPIQVGEVNIGSGNRVINSKPTWVNIDRSKVNSINKRWRNQVTGIRNWDTRYPARIQRWNNWGVNVRDRWGHHHLHDHWFDNTWWSRHRHPLCGWHYCYSRRPLAYWWSVPTYIGLRSWFVWTAPVTVWEQPIYYDYGPGGNVTFENKTVYVSNEPVASQEEYTQAVWDQATVSPPDNEEQVKQSEWQALGTFAVSTDEKDVNPSLVLQLAVNKQGIISGTLFNQQTDAAQTIQGQVDSETQRVAFRIGDSQSLLVETGLYNLTKEFTPVLVHYGTDKKETYMLVRLENPDVEQESN